MKRYCAICGEAFEAEKLSVHKFGDCRGQAYSTARGKTRYCLSCGELFTLNENGAGQFYCSPYRSFMLNRHKFALCAKSKILDEAEEKKPKRRKLTITDIQRLAEAEHLTYGEYVTKHGL